MWTWFLAYADKSKYRKIIEEIVAARKEIKMAQNTLESISQSEKERYVYRMKHRARQRKSTKRIDGIVATVMAPQPYAPV
jgi:uncharacterized protein YdeI (YjbR/CyaY-like superfamily)